MRKINLVRKCGWLLGCFLVAAGMTACTDDENKVEDLVPGEGFAEEITLLPSKGSQVVKFTANSNWTAKSSEDWLKLDGEALTSGKAGAVEMYVAFDTNELVTDRKADITVSAGSTLKTIKVTQKAAGRVIAFDGVAGDTLTMMKDQNEYEATILANVTWEFVADSLTADVKEWLKVTPGEGKVAIEILNQDGLARTARLVFRDKNFTSFTKALFVTVEGLGEEYLTWTLDKKMFTEIAENGEISATFIADVEPRALIMESSDVVTNVTADWITFEILPTSKSALQTQKWKMNVSAYSDVNDRLASIVLVPKSMTNDQVVEKIKDLKSEMVRQTNKIPTLKYGIWRYKFVEAKDSLDYVWEGYLDGNKIEFEFTEAKVALQISANYKVDNLKFGFWDGSAWKAQDPMTSIVSNGYFRDDSNTIIDIIFNGIAFMAPATSWMALDMVNEQGDVVKTVYLEMQQNKFQMPGM